VTWIKNKNQLLSGQFKADLNAPDQTECRQQKLATEPFAQLKIWLVIAHRLVPGIIDFECCREYKDNECLKEEPCWREVVDAFGTAIAVQAEVNATVCPIEHLCCQ